MQIRRIGRLGRLVTALAVLAAGAVPAVAGSAAAGPAAAGPHRAGCRTAWHQVAAPVTPDAWVSAGVIDALSTRDVRLLGTGAGRRPFALRWDGRSFRTAPTVPTTPLSGTSVGNGSFASGAAGWAMVTLNGGPLQSLARWDGTRWTVTPAAVAPDPDTTGVAFGDVAAPSPSDAWSVGMFYRAAKGTVPGSVSTGVAIQRWDGTRWRIVPNPASSQPHTVLVSVRAVSRNDVWAVGQQVNAADTIVPLIEHWDGTRWSVVPAATGTTPAALYGVSADAAGDAWAVGAQTNDAGVAVPLVERWDGHAWRAVSGLPDFGNAKLSDVFATGPYDVWAIPVTPNGTTEFAHWDGRAWTSVPLPGLRAVGLRYSYTTIGGTGPYDVWAAGTLTSRSAVQSRLQVIHLTCGAG